MAAAIRLLLVPLVTYCAPAHARDGDGRTLSTEDLGVVRVSADVASLQFWAEETGEPDDPIAAKSAVERAVNALTARWRQLGIAGDDVYTAEISITPDFGRAIRQGRCTGSRNRELEGQGRGAGR